MIGGLMTNDPTPLRHHGTYYAAYSAPLMKPRGRLKPSPVLVTHRVSDQVDVRFPPIPVIQEPTIAILMQTVR